MKIGFDAKRAFFNGSGLGNYSRTLLNSLLASFPENEFVLYSPKLPSKPINGFSAEKPFQIITPCKTIHKHFASIWRSKWMANQLEDDGIEVFHGLSAELPFGIHKTKVKTVVTIHDLIFLHHPELYGGTQARIYDKKSRYACEAADKIVAVSEETAAELVKKYKINPEKIQVIYQGIDPSFDRQWNAEELGKLRVKYEIKDPFAFFVGNIEPRKNLMQLIKGWEGSGIEDGQLLIGGSGKKYFEKLKAYLVANKLEAKVRLLGRIPAEDLPGLYQLARIFVYPALMEGFGIPILEALASGTPVITSKNGVFGEAGGKGSAYVEASSSKEIGATLQRVWADERRQKEMSAIGKEHYLNFGRKSLAAQWMALYQKLKQ